MNFRCKKTSIVEMTFFFQFNSNDPSYFSLEYVLQYTFLLE